MLVFLPYSYPSVSDSPKKDWSDNFENDNLKKQEEEQTKRGEDETTLLLMGSRYSANFDCISILIVDAAGFVEVSCENI